MNILPLVLEKIILQYKKEMEDFTFNEELEEEIKNIGFIICNDDECYYIECLKCNNINGKYNNTNKEEVFMENMYKINYNRGMDDFCCHKCLYDNKGKIYKNIIEKNFLEY